MATSHESAKNGSTFSLLLPAGQKMKWKLHGMLASIHAGAQHVCDGKQMFSTYC